jgi:hypothetical protein
LTDADVLAAQERLRTDPDFQDHFSELVGLQRVTSIQVSSATIRQLALQDLWRPDARRAFVVQVFTTMPEPRQWRGMA